jgi:hypothetical protein
MFTNSVEGVRAYLTSTLNTTDPSPLIYAEGVVPLARHGLSLITHDDLPYVSRTEHGEREISDEELYALAVEWERGQERDKLLLGYLVEGARLNIKSLSD